MNRIRLAFSEMASRSPISANAPDQLEAENLPLLIGKTRHRSRDGRQETRVVLDRSLAVGEGHRTWLARSTAHLVGEPAASDGVEPWRKRRIRVGCRGHGKRSRGGGEDLLRQLLRAPVISRAAPDVAVDLPVVVAEGSLDAITHRRSLAPRSET